MSAFLLGAEIKPAGFTAEAALKDERRATGSAGPAERSLLQTPAACCANYRRCTRASADPLGFMHALPMVALLKLHSGIACPSFEVVEAAWMRL